MFKIIILTCFVFSKLALKIRIIIQMCRSFFYISKFKHILPKLMFGNLNSKQKYSYA